MIVQCISHYRTEYPCPKCDPEIPGVIEKTVWSDRTVSFTCDTCRAQFEDENQILIEDGAISHDHS